MKDIRQGNDITVKWTVTAGSPIDLEEVELNLFDQYGDKAIINDVEVTVTGENVYLYQFKFYGKDQKRTGIYRVLLQRNVDEIGMVTLDKTSAFHLFGVCDFGIVRGEDEDHVETVVIELESTISTSVEGEGFDPELYYTKDETNALLAERQRAFTSQDPLEMRNNILRLKMLAIGNDVKGFVGTQVFPEVSTEKDAIMPSIKAIEDHIVAPLQSAINGKQDTIQDLSDIRSGASAGATAYQKPAAGIPATDLAQAVRDDLALAASALQDAPSDGKQYARKDGEWVEVEASGGGGSLTIVEVASGTTAIAAEADTYYKVAGQVTNLAATLPTMDDATKTARCLFLITAGSNPTITFGTAQSGATLAYFDGYSIGGGYTYIIQAEWAGGVWQMREARQSGGIGPSGQGEQVTVVLMKKSGDSVTTISSGANVIVTVDGTATVYTTNVSGEVSFVVPYGYTYTVEAARRNGQYISGNAYTQTYTAGQTERTITFVFRSYESGLFITTEDGTDYTLEQWEEAVTAGTRLNSEALYIHVVTSAFVDRSATFLIKIDHLRDRSYGGNTQWCTTNVQFNTIALNGTGDYDGATQTTKVITEATQRGLSVPAFTRCRNLYETVGGVRADGFLGAYQQWQFLWNNKAEVDDILVYTRPSGQYTFSSLTTNKWTSSQNSANFAYYWASAAGIINKYNSYVVIPFFAF